MFSLLSIEAYIFIPPFFSRFSWWQKIGFLLLHQMKRSICRIYHNSIITQNLRSWNLFLLIHFMSCSKRLCQALSKLKQEIIQWKSLWFDKQVHIVWWQIVWNLVLSVLSNGLPSDNFFLKKSSIWIEFLLAE